MLTKLGQAPATDRLSGAVANAGRSGRLAMSLTVEPVSSLPELLTLRECWDELLARCRHRDLFMSHEWTTAWWRHFGERSALWILLVKEGRRVLAIAPMMVRRGRHGGLPVRILGFLSNNHVSRSNFLIAERTEEVLRALACHWQERAAEWDLLRLAHTPCSAGFSSPLTAALRAARLDPFEPQESNRLLNIAVGGSLASYLSTRSLNVRKNLRKARNRLKGAGEFSREVFNTVARLDLALDAFFGLDVSSRKFGHAFAVCDANERAFYRSVALALAERHGYEVRLLQLDGEPIAGLLSLQFERTLYLMLTYFDERHHYLFPGHSLIWSAISDYWETGRLDCIDFNGNQWYHTRYATGAEIVETISACNRRPYSRCIGALKRLKRGLLGRMTDESPAKMHGESCGIDGDKP